MKTKIATFAAGCFWHVQNCFDNFGSLQSPKKSTKGLFGVEEVFSKIQGVLKTEVGYSGGITENPSYEQVSSGKTGHAEAIQIMYDPKKVSYEELLEVFWKIHDPTSLNRQGADIGTNYRSAIFYYDESQKKAAIKSKNELQKKLTKPIVTEISKAREFYPAEEYHQKYNEKHKSMSCRI